MKKLIVLLPFVLLAAACTKAEPPEGPALKTHRYPCGMSFFHFTKLPAQELRGDGDFITHIANEEDYSVIYMCNKKFPPALKAQIQDPANAQYKRVIDGRDCFAGDSEQERSTGGNATFYTSRVLCDNNGSMESVEIQIPQEKNMQRAKELSETILGSITFK